MDKLITQIKTENQDFEFYPTTKKMVEIIYNDIACYSRNDVTFNCLDIGCGNGNFFTKFDEIREEVRSHNISLGMGADEDFYYGEKSEEYYKQHMRPKASISEKFGIEKSEILIQNLPNNVIIIGTDFWSNTLLDKKVDVIFSNPPYSQFEEWCVKLINEAYCKTIYLILPERWENSDQIKSAIKERDFKVKILASDDFLDSERPARAKINIIRLCKVGNSLNEYYREKIDDPYDIWFEKNFLSSCEKEHYTSLDEKKEKQKENIKNEMLNGQNLIEALDILYKKEMENLMQSYMNITKIDPSILKELGVSHENIKIGLKEKVKGLKYKYWHELFNNLDKIKNRLTSNKRKMLLEKLYEHTSVDFSISNAYAIIIWVIKNSNQYFDQQLKEMFLRLTEPEYIKNYKSNQKTWEKNGWRYQKDDHSHYTLDYRIVTRDYKGYQKESDLISDIKTIANNLGFDDIGDVKEFKNGNVHFKFNKKFMKAFNIEAARILGWIQTPQDIVKEFDKDCEVTFDDAKNHFKGNFSIESFNDKLLLGI